MAIATLRMNAIRQRNEVMMSLQSVDRKRPLPSDAAPIGRELAAEINTAFQAVTEVGPAS